MRVPLDFPSLAGPVARALLGDPNPKLSTAAELRYGEHGRLSVRLAGERAGQWYDFAAGRGGGVLDLVIHAGEASARAGAVRWLESQSFADPVRARESVSELHPARQCDGAGEGRTAAYRQASRRDCARRLWDSTRPIAGTVAAAYLAARGVGHVAGARSLRFHPRIPHPHVPGRFPALVAGVQDTAGRFMGIQRIYLRADGPRKAALDPVRASLGSLAGGAVRLVPVPDDAVLVGEGIESTAAAVRVLDWPGGAWATLGTSGLRAIVLPAAMRRVVVAADRDPGGLRAAVALADRLESEGRRVTIEAPPFGDFADWQGESA